MMEKIVTSIAAILALAPWHSSRADVLSVYRCEDRAGAISLQDTPCPQDQTEELRRVRVAPPPEPDAATAVAPKAPAMPADSAPVRAESLPRPRPQPLYECHRPDGSVYESPDGVPQRQWVPLWVLGLDPRAPARTFGEVGRPPPRAPRDRPGVSAVRSDPTLGLGAGAWVEDRCQRLPDAMACARRREHLSELGRQIFQGQQRERERLRAQQRALRQQLRLECGGG